MFRINNNQIKKINQIIKSNKYKIMNIHQLNCQKYPIEEIHKVYQKHREVKNFKQQMELINRQKGVKS